MNKTHQLILMAVWGVPLFFFFAWMDKRLFGAWKWKKNALLILTGLTGGTAIGYVLIYWVGR